MKKHTFLILAILVSIFFISLLFKSYETDFLSPSGIERYPSNNNKEFIARIFTWEDSKKKKLKTTVHIPKKELTKEVKNFGVALDLVHPGYIKRQGFKKVKNLFIIDYKEVYRRNLKYFKEISNQLATSAGMRKAMDPLLNFLKFTQHIPYRTPPKYFDGRFFSEFFIPLQCLSEQYGDCDTKAILLADCLGAFTDSKEKIALIILKSYGGFHAILAVKRKPLPGMMKLFIHNRGYYIPLETTAPGWMPGFVGKGIVYSLKAGLFIFEDLN